MTGQVNISNGQVKRTFTKDGSNTQLSGTNQGKPLRVTGQAHTCKQHAKHTQPPAVTRNTQSQHRICIHQVNQHRKSRNKHEHEAGANQHARDKRMISSHHSGPSQPASVSPRPPPPSCAFSSRHDNIDPLAPGLGRGAVGASCRLALPPLSCSPWWS